MMFSSMSLATTFVALLMASSSHAIDGGQNPSYQGCYKSKQGLTFKNTDIYQSNGACQTTCFPLGKAVMAMTGGNQCFCGDEMPPLSDKVDNSKCDTQCVGFPPDNCGSASGATPVYYAVWNSGLKSVITNAVASSSASAEASSTTASSAAVVTVSGGQTIVVTASSTPSAGSSSSGPSTAGIAAGVVVGVIAIAAIGGGVWFFMRARARRDVEEEYKRQMAVNAFINGGKPGSSASSNTDSRLDPVIMTQRRMSDGSIADNQDYSRRILKVTNA